MADFTSTNPICGGLYQAGIEIKNTKIYVKDYLYKNDFLTIDFADEGILTLRIDSFSRENEDDDSLIYMTFSNENRTKLSQYFRLIADMIDRPRLNKTQ